MKEPLPPLSEWLRWLGEMPSPFRLAPEGLPGGVVRVSAVVADLFETAFGAPPQGALLDAFRATVPTAATVPTVATVATVATVPTVPTSAERNRLGFVLVACHLFSHPSLRGRPLSAAGLRTFLVQELASLAHSVSVSSLDSDEERREELVRRALRALGEALPGESASESEDRLRQVDSVERRRVLAAAAEREKRSREVREKMAKKAAEEAAAKVGRE